MIALWSGLSEPENIPAPSASWFRWPFKRRATEPREMTVPLSAVIAWGRARRDYDLAHPLGSDEVLNDDGSVAFSRRPAFLSYLIAP